MQWVLHHWWLVHQDWWHLSDFHKCGHRHVSTVLHWWLILGMSHSSYMDDSGREPRFLVSLRTEKVCLAKSSDYSCNFSGHDTSRQSWSAAAYGCVFCICCGTLVHNAHWYRSFAGEHRCALMGVLQCARRAKYGSWPEHFAWVRSALKIVTAASAWPLPLGILGALVLWSNIQSVANSVNNAFAYCRPLLVCMDSGIPYSANNSFMISTVFAALH